MNRLIFDFKTNLIHRDGLIFKRSKRKGYVIELKDKGSVLVNHYPEESKAVLCCLEELTEKDVTNVIKSILQANVSND